MLEQKVIARDIMTADVIYVKPEDSVDSVAKLLVDNKISGIPVVDEDHRIIGIITEKDLMIKASELKVPFYITLFDSIIFLENPIHFNNKLKKYTAYRVKDAMTKKVYTLDEEAPITEAVDLMQKHHINRLPVVRDGKLVGIVTRNDILKSLVKSNG